MMSNAKSFLLAVVIASIILTFAVVQSVPPSMDAANQVAAGDDLPRMDVGQADQIAASDELSSMDAAKVNWGSAGDERRIAIFCTSRCPKWVKCVIKNPLESWRCGREPLGCKCKKFV